jgi:hypothetical protein
VVIVQQWSFNTSLFILTGQPPRQRCVGIKLLLRLPPSSAGLQLFLFFDLLCLTSRFDDTRNASAQEGCCRYTKSKFGYFTANNPTVTVAMSKMHLDLQQASPPTTATEYVAAVMPKRKHGWTPASNDALVGTRKKPFRRKQVSPVVTAAIPIGTNGRQTQLHNTGLMRTGVGSNICDSASV